MSKQKQTNSLENHSFSLCADISIGSDIKKPRTAIRKQSSQSKAKNDLFSFLNTAFELGNENLIGIIVFQIIIISLLGERFPS